MTLTTRRLLPALLALLVLALPALLLGACGGEGGDAGPRPGSSSPTPTSTPTPTPAPSASTGPAPTPGAGAVTGWRLERRTLESGRAYLVGVPTCTGSSGCAAWLEHPRKLVISLHGAMEVESEASARAVINGVFTLTGGDAVPVVGLSAGGSRVWDADQCCTFHEVDEIGYLQDVISDVAAAAPVDPARVGLIGVSNGGMLATKAICERPDLFKAVAVWGASWKGACDRAPVAIGHWHGTADATIPVGGGTTPVLGHRVTFAPADWLEGRLAKGSTFKLVLVKGAPHWPAPAWAANAIVTWLDGRL